MPFCLKMRSASGVVGPFAPSTMSLALTFDALSDGEDLLERRGHQHVAIRGEQFCVADAIATLEAFEAAILDRMIDCERNVDAFGIVKRAGHIGDPAHLAATLRKEFSRVESDVPEALNDDPRLFGNETHLGAFRRCARW